MRSVYALRRLGVGLPAAFLDTGITGEGAVWGQRIVLGIKANGDEALEGRNDALAAGRRDRGQRCGETFEPAPAARTRRRSGSTGDCFSQSAPRNAATTAMAYMFADSAWMFADTLRMALGFASKGASVVRGAPFPRTGSRACPPQLPWWHAWSAPPPRFVS